MLLTAMVRTASPSLRSHHVFGSSDAEGFAAMGVVETLVHTHDVALGLGLRWTPPEGPCAAVPGRLAHAAVGHRARRSPRAVAPHRTALVRRTES